jgi:hypothetical protein
MLEHSRWLLLLCAPSLYAQAVSATLVGTVTDASGGVIANAKITIGETATGVSYSRDTNSSGNFTFPSLPPGRYNVTAEMPGFKKGERPGVEIVLDTITRVDLQLQPGNVIEIVEVAATAPLVRVWTDGGFLQWRDFTLQFWAAPPRHEPDRPVDLSACRDCLGLGRDLPRAASNCVTL